MKSKMSQENVQSLSLSVCRSMDYKPYSAPAFLSIIMMLALMLSGIKAYGQACPPPPCPLGVNQVTGGNFSDGCPGTNSPTVGFTTAFSYYPCNSTGITSPTNWTE